MRVPMYLSDGQKASFLRTVAILAILALANSLIACGEGESETDETVEQESIEEKGLVILVEYPDVEHTIGREFAQGRFSELDSYVREMSYGKAGIDVDVTEKWYQMPHPVPYYKISPRNLEVDKSRVESLIQDSIDAVDGEVDLTRYHFIAIFMSARREEYGMIGLCGYPGMLGWTADKVPETKSGKIIKGGVAIFSYQAHLGTLFHDIAHIMGGVQDGRRMVPCLYDHDLQARGSSCQDNRR